MKRLMVLAMAVMAAGAASAYVWRPLSVPEMAQWNATHVLEFDYSDLSASTATNTAKTMLTKEVFVAGTEDGTNFVTQAVVTNATVATSMMVTELGRKASTAAHNVVVTLTPNEEEALSANSSGKVKLFFRLTDWRK